MLGKHRITLFVSMVLLIFLTNYIVPTHASQTEDFPIGFSLEYDVVQKISFDTIPLASYSYEVIDWLGPSVFMMTIIDSNGEHSIHVTLPQWYATHENGTAYGTVKPLWMDISSWKRNDNVSLGSMGVFQLVDSRTVDADAGEFQCWTARKETTTSSYNQYEHYYYSHSHGLLIKHWRSNWYDTYVSEVTTELVASNVNDYDPIYFNTPLASPFNLVLLGGILIEIFVIIHLVRTRLKHG